MFRTLRRIGRTSVPISDNLGKARKKLRALASPEANLVARAKAGLTAGRRARQQIASNNREISALRRELAEARGGVAGHPGTGASSPVFFVVGYQKSGTTWLQKMLDTHPEVLCDGEGRPFGRNWRQEYLKQKAASYPPTSLYHAILSAEDLRYWVERSVWSKRDDTEEHLGNLTRLAVEYFLTQRLLKSGKRFVGDKTVLQEPGIVREIGEIFPEARVIHIVRDGRDVAVSAMHHRWNQAEDRGGTVALKPEEVRKRAAYAEDPETLIASGGGIFSEGWLESRSAKWAERVGGTVKDGPALLGPRYAEVRYEDLLVQPEREMERLFGFLGADASEGVVRRCVEAASFGRLSQGRKRGEEAASFFRKGIAGDWKNVFTERDRAVFKDAAGDVLVALGYERDRDW
jgi:hypothetical protein